MVHNKRSKNSRQRGSKTHGWGSMKKHRGAGHRGGRGAAGSGKRGDAKKPSIWARPKPKGFTSKNTASYNPVTLSHLVNFKKTLLAKQVLTLESGFYVVNLTDFGYTKLLGNGQVTEKFKITTLSATPSAIEKVKKAGGEVIVLSEKEE